MPKPKPKSKSKPKKVIGDIHLDPIQGKPPLPPFEPNQNLIDQLKIFEIFATVEINSPIFTELSDAMDYDDPEKWQKIMKDPNLVVLYQQLKFIQNHEEDNLLDGKPSVLKKALINMKKLDIVLYRINPWYRSRRGWDMWWAACHQDPNAYYPLGWEAHFDPRIWYRVGEPIRPEGSEPRWNFSNFYPVEEKKADDTESGTNPV